MVFTNIRTPQDEHHRDSRAKVDKYKADAEKRINRFEKKMEDYVKELRADSTRYSHTKTRSRSGNSAGAKNPGRSQYVCRFPSSLGQLTYLDVSVLILMFFTFFIGTMIALRAQDV